jgi:hypothetical protein
MSLTSKTTLLSLIFALSLTQALAFEVEPTHLPTEPVVGPPWASFSVYGKALSMPQVQRACGLSGFRLARPSSDRGTTVFMGCSMVSFASHQCHYVYVKGNKEAQRHEAAHCSGLDHAPGAFRGEVSLSDGWARLRARMTEHAMALQRANVPDEDIPRLVLQRQIEQETAVLERMKWPLTTSDALRDGWSVERH